ncbi:hypothetical protein [Nonomuraea typhae]|uniref:hypothetical protein n=1 Tax=Nonomuraea typhae TaxID=2603600 RepID=UPI0015E21432|nr:hypothetical protein [Nonomuraea typhae]
MKHPGDTHAVRNRVRFRSRATGKEAETLIVQLITVRDGRMLECRPFCWDPRAVNAARDPVAAIGAAPGERSAKV